jgi:hypothetical protein
MVPAAGTGKSASPRDTTTVMAAAHARNEQAASPTSRTDRPITEAG